MLSLGQTSLIGPAAPPALHVMSWNIRRRIAPVTLRAADRWKRRAPRVRALLGVEQPTILGAQEALPDQVRFLQSCLGNNYRVIGQGRGTGGRGEACPIFYDTRRLELLDWKQSALSNHPARPGSISWGNIIPRIMVSATFREHESSRRFIVINTHLDHLSRRSRLCSARAILQALAESGLPAVVTGDFNADAKSPALRELLAAGALADTWEMAQAHRSQPWGTFPNYRGPRHGGRRLDWILVSPKFQVLSTAINSQRYAGNWASDHLPVQAVLLQSGEGGTQ